MNVKWFSAIAVIPIISMLLGFGAWYYTQKLNQPSTSQCVVAIEKSGSDNDPYVDMLVTSNGVVIEANKAGVFIVPCVLNNSNATLHNSETKSFLGKITLKLDPKQMQIVNSYQLTR